MKTHTHTRVVMISWLETEHNLGVDPHVETDLRNGLWTGRLQNLRGRNLNSAATVSEWVRNSNASAMCLGIATSTVGFVGKLEDFLPMHRWSF